MAEVTDSTKIWRVMELINWTTDYLAEKNFDTPRSDVEWLLSAALECPKVELYTNFDKPLTRNELNHFKELLKERLTRKPVQYIIGETEFMGLPFRVNESVLIPRPETELLVEKAVDWLRANADQKTTVLDIGTGSGCIAVSVAALVPEITVIAIDNSETALKVARENARLNQVDNRIQFARQDILTEWPGDNPFTVILSNPPYVAKDEYDRLQPDVREYEPESALVADDGLTFIRRFAESARDWLDQSGILFLEIGGSHQRSEVENIFGKFCWNDVIVEQDYNGEARVVRARKL